jgi:asparagine synthase (glutamine-hydrolysing)
MCGIVGYFDLPIAEDEKLPLLKRMCDTIIHRGPDDEGYWANEYAGLGMRRLSIIDLSSGHQPIHSADRKKHIVFNGEIYNYRELRPALIQKGYPFSTQSDTEVILAQYEVDGIDCIKKFNGMFTIAILDETKQRIFLARDRMGIKPLYYYWDGSVLIFGSEIKAILASDFITKKMNPNALWDYLTYRYVPQGESIWQGIHKLPPAHILTLTKGDTEPSIRRYWDIPYSDHVPHLREEAALEQFTDLFLDSVRLRLISDVPVGILLSGGLDSSAVTAAVAEKHNARLNSFSVAFADAPQIDETPYARMVADHIGTDHHEIVINQQEFCDFLPQFVEFTDEPLADLASIPLYYVSKLAREQVKVVLSGEGSDEILGGYDFEIYVNEFDRRRAYQRIPNRFRKMSLLKKIASLSGLQVQDKFSLNNQPLDMRLLDQPMSATSYLSHEAKQKLLLNNSFEDSFKIIRDDLSRCHCKDPLNQILFIFSQGWLVEDLLMKADRMSMANSIELRTPFLDYRLVEWAAKIPSKYKVGQDGSGRYISKKVLRQFALSRLPGEIINREKRGFPVPVYEWLSGSKKSWAFEILGSKNTYINNWLDPKEVRRLLEDGTQSGSSLMSRHYLWSLIILEFWAQRWFNQ